MSKTRRYESEGVDILFEPSKCIHAARCVHGLPGVFDAQRRPWIDATQAGPDAIAAVVQQCPSGALGFERHDGGPTEAAPSETSIRISKNGPIFVHGALNVIDGAGEPVTVGPRLALCRCGASKNKPFCDNSHKDIDFVPDGD